MAETAKTVTGAPGLRAALRSPAAAAAALSLLVYALVRHGQAVSMVDMLVYRAEGAAVAHGQDLYAMRLPGWNLPATYPPFAALLFVPSTWLGIGALRVVVTAVNVLLLALLSGLSFRLAGWPRERHRPAAVLLCAGFGVWLEPVYTTLQYGQVNLGIACLVLWDFTRRDQDLLKGVGIGLAAGIKITPALFAVYLLLTGRVRAAAVAGGTFLATAALGAVSLPGASYGFWTRYLWDSSRVGLTELVDNQSIRGAVARLMSRHDPGATALVACLLAAVCGLAVAAAAGRSARIMRRAEAWGVVCTAVTALLVSPISWTHHWVWCVPLLVLLAAEAAGEAARPPGLRRRRHRVVLATVTAAFLSYAMWLVPQSGGLGVPAYWQPASSVYPLTGAAVLALAAVRLRRAHRAAAGPPAAPWLPADAEPEAADAGPGAGAPLSRRS